MIAVAICSLVKDPLGGIDAEAQALARDLGSGVYDARLKLSQPLPIIIYRTNDADAARALATSLRARGHEVVALDEARVPEPVVVRTFRFGQAFECGDEAIAYADIVAFVRAARTHKTETTTRVTERKLRPAAAIATGGLILSKKVSRDEKRTTHDREELLFVFSRAAAPWLIAERSTSYASLAARGDAIAAASRENFLRVLGELRTRAPHAPLDEKLLAHKHLETLEDITLRAQALTKCVRP
jgi:hypothetical protein